MATTKTMIQLKIELTNILKDLIKDGEYSVTDFIASSYGKATVKQNIVDAIEDLKKHQYGLLNQYLRAVRIAPVEAPKVSNLQRLFKNELAYKKSIGVNGNCTSYYTK